MDNEYRNKLHRLGRFTVILALACFMLVPFALAAINGINIDVAAALKNGVPLLLTFTITAVVENLSFMPMIGSGALYMSCVTGNVSNMKIPAAMNAMELAGYEPGSEQSEIIAMVAVAASTFVTTGIVFAGMLFLAPLFEPVYNNPFLQPAFQNMVPALFGALVAPAILKSPKQSVVPILLPIIVVLSVGRKFFSSNQSYIMVGVILCSCFYTYLLYKQKKL